MSTTTLEISSVAIVDIVVTSDNPRTTFGVDAMDQLTESIRAHGVLSPIILWRQGEALTLMAGERRLRAAESAGLTHIPARILEGLTHDQARAIALVENLQRVDLGVIDEAEAFDSLIGAGHTVDGIANSISKSEAYVRARVQLFALTKKAQQFVRINGLGISYAAELARLTVGQQVELLRDHEDRLFSPEPSFDGLEGREVVSLAQFRAVIRDLFSQPEQELPIAEEPEQVEAEPAAEPEVDEEKQISDAGRKLQSARDRVRPDWAGMRDRVLSDAEDAFDAVASVDKDRILELLIPLVPGNPYRGANAIVWCVVRKLAESRETFAPVAKILGMDLDSAAKRAGKGKKS